MREYFCAYHSMLDATRKLSDAEVGRLFRGLLLYSATEEYPQNLQGREEIVFDIFAQQIDREIEKYKLACERNKRNGASRCESVPVAASRCQSQRVAAKKCQSHQKEEKEKEEDKDKEKDEEELIARAREENPFGDGGGERPDFNTVEAYVSGNIPGMNWANLQEMATFKADLPEDVIRYAVDKACERNVRNWGYVKGILNRIIASGNKTLAEVKEADERFAGSGKARRAAQENPALQYEQRPSSDYDDSVFIDLEKLYGEDRKEE